jgi:hypothetical protein
MGKLLKLKKQNQATVLLKLIQDVAVGDHIGLPVGEHKVYAEVVSLPHPTKPLIIYKIWGTESIGVVNLQRSQVFRLIDPHQTQKLMTTDDQDLD